MTQIQADFSGERLRFDDLRLQRAQGQAQLAGLPGTDPNAKLVLEIEQAACAPRT